jgi:NADPH:quinone reductase-like Zn-dependent oxidoreductase
MAQIASGQLHPVEPTVYPLERTVEALDDLAERRASGKLVVVP